MAGESRYGGLAVGSGDREHRLSRMPGEELDVAQYRDCFSDGLSNDRFFQRKTGTDAHGVDVVEQSLGERPGVQRAGKVGLSRRIAPAVREAHPAAFALDPAGERKTGVAQPEHEHAPSHERRGRRLRQLLEGRFAHHRSLSVDRPKSTSIMVMIQKRTTTWLSFQPSSS